MTQFPVWVSVVTVLGVIAAGIGLGYLIIFLFWKIERYFSPKVVAPPVVQPEEQEEEPPVQPEPVVEPEVEEESIEPMDEEIKEEIAPVMAEVARGEGNRSIKFTMVLHAKFGHPFHKADTIVCWELALEDGEEVRDSEGNGMKFRVIKPQSEAEPARYVLVDDTGQRTISVINGKEYVQRKTNIDLDRIPG